MSSSATLTAISSYRNTDYTKVTPGQFTGRRNRPAARTTLTATTAPAATPLDGFAARMRGGEFSFAVADGLAALLDIPQNTKRTGESVVLYALPRVTPSVSGNDVTFFEVKSFNGRNGKTRRIRQLVGAPGTWHRETLSLKQQCLALYHILENQKAAKALFSAKATACCLCGSPLTNKVSRDRGVGPECIKKI